MWTALALACIHPAPPPVAHGSATTCHAAWCAEVRVVNHSGASVLGVAAEAPDGEVLTFTKGNAIPENGELVVSVPRGRWGSLVVWTDGCVWEPLGAFDLTRTDMVRVDLGTRPARCLAGHPALMARAGG